MDNDDIKLKLFAGLPIEIPECGFLSPPITREIARIGEKNHNELLSLLLIDKNNVEGLNDPNNTTNFEVLLFYCYQSEDIFNRFKKGIELFFKSSDVFLHEDGYFFIGDNRFITKDNFDLIQKVLMVANHIEPKVQEIEYKPANDKVAEYMEKMKRLKSQLQKKNADEGLNLNDIASIVAAYIPDISIFTVWDLTIYQLYVLYIRLMMKDNYDAQFSFMLQGAEIKPEDLKHWATKINKI